MTLTVKHFWLLKYEDAFYWKERGKDVFVALPKEDIQRFMSEGIAAVRGAAPRDLFVFLSKFKNYTSQIFSSWQEFVPLSALKLIAVTIACRGDEKLIRLYLPKLHKLEVLSKFKNMGAIRKDQTAARYFEILLSIERTIKGYYLPVHGEGGSKQIRNVFPLNINNEISDEKMPWPEFLGYVVMSGSFKKAGGLSYQNTRSSFVVLRFKKCADAIFGISNAYYEERNNVFCPSIVELVLACCFEDDFLSFKKVPREIFESNNVAKKTFLRAVFDEKGATVIERKKGVIKSVIVTLYHKRKIPLEGIKSLCDNFFSSTLVEFKLPLISIEDSSRKELIELLRDREDILFDLGFKGAAEMSSFFNRPTVGKEAFLSIVDLVNRHVQIEPQYSELIWHNYRLWVRAFSDVLSFASEIGFSDPEKAKRLLAMIKIFRESKGKAISREELAQVVQAEIEDIDD